MEEHRIFALHFVGQQDGDTERKFLSKVAKELEAAAVIERGYLCRVHYGNPREINVALCMSLPRSDPQAVLNSVAVIFHEMFGTHEHLDMLFVNQGQETQLCQVCKPFYSTEASLPK